MCVCRAYILAMREKLGASESLKEKHWIEMNFKTLWMGIKWKSLCLTLDILWDLLMRGIFSVSLKWIKLECYVSLNQVFETFIDPYFFLINIKKKSSYIHNLVLKIQQQFHLNILWVKEVRPRKRNGVIKNSAIRKLLWGAQKI